jgi:hypothetical protein
MLDQADRTATHLPVYLLVGFSCLRSSVAHTAPAIAPTTAPTPHPTNGESCQRAISTACIMSYPTLRSVMSSMASRMSRRLLASKPRPVSSWAVVSCRSWAMRSRSRVATSRIFRSRARRSATPSSMPRPVISRLVWKRTITRSRCGCRTTGSACSNRSVPGEGPENHALPGRADQRPAVGRTRGTRRHGRDLYAPPGRTS